MKKCILLSIFFAFSIPFVAVQTFYPFYRFGMFAEPQNQSPAETLRLYLYSENRNTVLFEPTTIGLTYAQFNYLLRKHFYTNNLPTFCKNLKALIKHKHALKWLCIRKKWSLEKSQIQIDTLVVRSD